MCVRHLVVFGSAPIIQLSKLLLRYYPPYPLCMYDWQCMAGSLDWALHSSTDLLCLTCGRQFVVLGILAFEFFAKEFFPIFNKGKVTGTLHFKCRDGPVQRTETRQG